MQAILERSLRLLGIVSLFSACVSLAALVALFISIIIGRVIGYSLPSADLFGSILLAATFSFGLAAVVAREHHLRVDFLIERLGPQARTVAEAVALVFSVAITGYLVKGLYSMWIGTIISGATMIGILPIPRAIPVGAVLIGVAAFEIALILRLMLHLTGRTNFQQGTQIIGD